MASKKKFTKIDSSSSVKEAPTQLSYEDQVNKLLGISSTRDETKRLASNNLSREFLLGTLKEIVQAWNGCDATVAMAPDVGVPRLFKAIGVAMTIVKNEH
jgi:hypothetical protein